MSSPQASVPTSRPALRWTTATSRAASIVVLAGAVLLPAVVRSDAAMTVCIYGLLMAGLAVSFNLVFGYCGQLSLFHSAAFGIGAYGTSVLVMKFGWGFWAALLPSLALAVVLAVAVGMLCFAFKLREFYFAIVTMAMAELVRLLVQNWNSVTDGTLGMTTVITPAVGDWAINGTVRWYYAALVLLVVVMAVCGALVRGWTGRCFEAIRLNDTLAESLGISVFVYKLLAFVAASALAALIGAFYGAYSGFVEPRYLAIANSLDIIAMVLLGGVGTLYGPVIGAFVLTLLPHVIALSAELRVMVYGAILIFVILAMPRGIVGLLTGRRHAV